MNCDYFRKYIVFFCIVMVSLYKNYKKKIHNSFTISNTLNNKSLFLSAKLLNKIQKYLVFNVDNRKFAHNEEDNAHINYFILCINDIL